MLQETIQRLNLELLEFQQGRRIVRHCLSFIYALKYV
jgi:hypothetical protein